MDVRVDPARRAGVDVTIGGHSATSILEPYLISLEYSDQAEGKSDEIRIDLHDRDGKWIGGWLPAKGTVIAATIRCRDWWGRGHDATLACGSFVCDEMSISGPPAKISIKGVSASLSGPLRETSRSEGWGGYSLKGVAAQIAKRHGMELYYDAEPHPFSRQDQRGESDLAFLQRLAEDRGVALKVREGRLVLFDAAAAEARPAALAFHRTSSADGLLAVAEYEFRRASEGTGYASAKIQYHDPSAGELYDETFAPDDATAAPDGKTLDLDLRAESPADARALARGKLRQANKNELTGSFSVMGHPGLVAGITVEMVDFGLFSGRYFVTKTTHSLGAKYTTRAEIRRVLGY